MGGSGLLNWERSEAEVWLHDAEVGEEGLGLLVADGGVDNDIITGDPVDWGGDSGRKLVWGFEREQATREMPHTAACLRSGESQQL